VGGEEGAKARLGCTTAVERRLVLEVVITMFKGCME
jgi:hypothetical protein